MHAVDISAHVNVSFRHHWDGEELLVYRKGVFETLFAHDYSSADKKTSLDGGVHGRYSMDYVDVFCHVLFIGSFLSTRAHAHMSLHTYRV